MTESSSDSDSSAYRYVATDEPVDLTAAPVNELRWKPVKLPTGDSKPDFTDATDVVDITPKRAHHDKFGIPINVRTMKRETKALRELRLPRMNEIPPGRLPR